MKRYRWLVLALALFVLGACQSKGDQAKKKTEASSSQVEELKTRAFEIPLENGSKQKQTILYKGDQVQRLTMKTDLTMTEDLTRSIAENGLEETQRLLKESMAEDPDYQYLSGIVGLVYEVHLTADNQFYIVFTLDVPNLDSEALARSSVFSGSGIEDVKVIGAEKYIARLEGSGGVSVAP